MKFRLLLLILLSIICFVSVATAIPSIAPRDMLQLYVKYKDDQDRKIIQVFTLLRDADQFDLFYYLPGQPQLNEVNGKPEFTLLRYQELDSATNSLKEGGILQFSCSLNILPKVKELLKGEIVKSLKARIPTEQKLLDIDNKRILNLVKDGKPVSKIAQRAVEYRQKWIDGVKTINEKSLRLLMIPLKDAQVELYTPGGEEMLKSTQGPAIAPTHAGAKIPFSLTLSKLGTNVYKSLTEEGNTGIPIVVSFTYSGLSAPSTFRIIVDWDQSFKHFSKSNKVSVGASFGPFGGANASTDISSIREDLINNKCISIDIVAAEGFDKSDLDEYIEPILQRINDELTVTMKPPSVDPAGTPRPQIAKKPGVIGEIANAFGLPAYQKMMSFGVKAESKFEMKDVTKVKKGKEVIDFTARRSIDRQSMTGGFISIASYPEEIRKSCITTVARGGWESAWFVLPALSDKLADMGLTSIDMTISVIAPDGKSSQRQTARWTPNQDGWEYLGKNRPVIPFALQEFYEKFGDEKMKKEAKYQVETQFNFLRDSFINKQTIAMFQGENPVASPLNEVDVISFDFSNLTFATMEDFSTLESINVKLKSGNRKLQPPAIKAKDGELPEDKDHITWFIDSTQPIKALVEFNYREPFSDKNLRKRKLLTHNWIYNDIDLNSPLAPYKKNLKAKSRKKLQEKIKKLFSEAAEAEGTKKAELIKSAIDEYMSIYQIRNANASEAKRDGPGLTISFEDATLRDLYHTSKSQNNQDSSEFVANLAKKLSERDEEITMENLQDILATFLWFQYEE